MNIDNLFPVSSVSSILVHVKPGAGRIVDRIIFFKWCVDNGFMHTLFIVHITLRSIFFIFHVIHFYAVNNNLNNDSNHNTRNKVCDKFATKDHAADIFICDEQIIYCRANKNTKNASHHQAHNITRKMVEFILSIFSFHVCFFVHRVFSPCQRRYYTNLHSISLFLPIKKQEYL